MLASDAAFVEFVAATLTADFRTLTIPQFVNVAADSIDRIPYTDDLIVLVCPAGHAETALYE